MSQLSAFPVPLDPAASPGLHVVPDLPVPIGQGILPEEAPFDSIIVTAAPRDVPGFTNAAVDGYAFAHASLRATERS